MEMVSAAAEAHLGIVIVASVLLIDCIKTFLPQRVMVTSSESAGNPFPVNTAS